MSWPHLVLGATELNICDLRWQQMALEREKKKPKQCSKQLYQLLFIQAHVDTSSDLIEHNSNSFVTLTYFVHIHLPCTEWHLIIVKERRKFMSVFVGGNAHKWHHSGTTANWLGEISLFNPNAGHSSNDVKKKIVFSHYFSALTTQYGYLHLIIVKGNYLLKWISIRSKWKWPCWTVLVFGVDMIWESFKQWM